MAGEPVCLDCGQPRDHVCLVCGFRPAPPPVPPRKEPPMRHCFNCGAELGRHWDHEPLDTCGKSACEREARDIVREERREAHDKLDRDRGWS